MRAGETVEITDQGQAVAVLMPVQNQTTVPLDIEERQAALARMDALAEEIGKGLTGQIDVTEILREMRR